MVFDEFRKKLKTLFVTESVKEDVKFNELLQWFNEKTSTIFKDLNNAVYENYNTLNEELGKLSRAITKLETAEIKDPDKIEHKVKQVVLDNRANYIRQLSFFLKSVEIPSDFDHSTAIDFCKNIDEKLNNLGKSTKKSYYTAQHLFFDEVEAVVKILKNIDLSGKELKKTIEQKDIALIEEAKNDIKAMLAKKENKEKIELGLNAKHQERKETVKQRNDLMKKIIEVERSQQHIEYMRIQEDETQLKAQFNRVIDEIYTLFSPFDRAFRKFVRITVMNDKLLNEYIADPLKALIDDKELVIITILENLGKNIEAGSVELKDSDKILAKLNEIKPELLKEKVERHNKIEASLRDIENKRSSMMVVEEKNRLDKELENLNSKLKRLDEEIKELDKKSSLDFSKAEEEIRTKIRKLININVAIVHDEEKINDHNPPETATKQ